jgi:hypothetical protein
MRRYNIRLRDKTTSGMTDPNGRTERIATDAASNIIIEKLRTDNPR